MPENYTFSRFHFQGQHENEQILQVIHRHWFNILMHLGLVIILSIILLGSVSALPILFSDLTDDIAPFLIFIENTILLFIWLYGFLVDRKSVV